MMSLFRGGEKKMFEQANRAATRGMERSEMIDFATLK